jgi:hypothetical protein
MPQVSFRNAGPGERPASIEVFSQARHTRAGVEKSLPELTDSAEVRAKALLRRRALTRSPEAIA